MKCFCCHEHRQLKDVHCWAKTSRSERHNRQLATCIHRLAIPDAISPPSERSANFTSFASSSPLKVFSTSTTIRLNSDVVRPLLLQLAYFLHLYWWLYFFDTISCKETPRIAFNDPWRVPSTSFLFLLKVPVSNFKRIKFATFNSFIKVICKSFSDFLCFVACKMYHKQYKIYKNIYFFVTWSHPIR